MHIHLEPVDYLIIGIYFVFVLGIGFLIKRTVRSSTDFLLSSRSIPLWITSLAFVSANLGAQELIGMGASGAKYGIMSSHFYWVGAIPAMVFLGVFMMPFYYGSRARSVPEYLSLRFDERTRGLNAVSFAVMTIFSSGISLYALALLLESILGWEFNTSIFLAALIVMAYTLLGGLTSAVYNEVLQFFLIMLGVAPVVFISLGKIGGWAGVSQHLRPEMVSTWRYMGSPAENPMGVDTYSMLFGLGFVLSFGYWCTDFLVVQRAMIARNLSEAQRTPLIAAFPKMIIPFVVILPGVAAIALHTAGAGYHIPTKADGTTLNYDLVIPSLLAQYYPNGLLGVGLTALIASFMSGMAGNVTAFNTVFTFDIYQAYIRPNAGDAHYLRAGRLATIFGIVASIGTAYLATAFNNIMDYLQLVFGFVNAPLFATFALGMFWKRTTPTGAFWGLLAGTGAAALTHGLTSAEGKGAWLANWHTFSSSMSQNFVVASVAWVVCFVATFGLSWFTTPRSEADLVGLVYSLTPRPDRTYRTVWQNPVWLGVVVILIAVALNVVFL